MVKPEGKKLDELIENKFYCAKRFTEAIENIAVENKGMSYVDAIVFFCEKIVSDHVFVCVFSFRRYCLSLSINYNYLLDDLNFIFVVLVV